MIEMNMRASRSPASVAILLALCLLGLACDQVELEFDKMTGTTFPQPQTVGNTTVSLSSIYLNQGLVNLIVDEDDTSIAPLGGEGITDAELDLFEWAFRDTPITPSWSTTYRLYGLVADYYHESADGTLMKMDGGVMWKTEFRSAFAIFYKAALIQDPEKYLLAVAHEVGHAFNLHHEDANATTKTVMYSPIPNIGDANYEFSADSIDHLLNHPEDCRRPGIGVFTVVHPSHPNHGATTICNNCDAQSMAECL